MEFVKIKNRKKPGEFLVLAKKDFDPSAHELFVEPKGATAPSASAGATTGADVTGPPASPSIVNLSVAKASEVIVTATAEELVVVEQAEKAHPKYSGGRQGVLEAIAARREALAAGART
jgi:hypothetical protein